MHTLAIGLDGIGLVFTGCLIIILFAIWWSDRK